MKILNKTHSSFTSNTNYILYLQEKTSWDALLKGCALLPITVLLHKAKINDILIKCGKKIKYLWLKFAFLYDTKQYIEIFLSRLKTVSGKRGVKSKPVFLAWWKSLFCFFFPASEKKMVADSRNVIHLLILELPFIV